MLRAQPLEVIRNELKRRRQPAVGRNDQLASRLYSALMAEGRALNSEESLQADADLGLTDIAACAAGSTDSEGDSEDEGVAAGEVASPADVAANPLLALQSSIAGRFLTEANMERLMSNAGSLQLYFLWGTAAPNGVKLTTSCLARTTKSVWLFECGEDAQRHLVKSQAVAWAKLERIFISSMAFDNISGLPGMLCTISASREKGHESADLPLHVYGPPGLADYINTMLTVSRTYLEMPVIIHELSTAPVPADQLDEPVQINPRSRLYVLRLPPDQLNPEGYYDGEITALLARHTRKRSNSGIDLRAGTLPQALPPPGDERRTGLTVADLTWTLRMDHEWVVRCAPLRARQPTFGFLMQEAARVGKLYVERAQALGVQPGADFTTLKMGGEVYTPDGRLVQSLECVGPPRRGRRIAFIGTCLDSAGFAQSMGAADWSSPGADEPPVVDVVVHCMSPPAGAPAGTPRTAAGTVGGAAARALRARELVLWQRQAALVAAPEGRDPAFPGEVLEAARASFGQEHVSLAGCYWCYQPDREPEAAEWAEKWSDDSPAAGPA
ncbi:Zinc phosphodiesterase ELAC 1 [Micractinium conductrix]|uniref:Zinc phosphodiesterase ELAC 1 n=1 Tax=Micractinium conductrix TaxID=554055 RepID=A0A2P6VI57_9CHLO|nr:Zinc phosphodiesterase ELAC 1 [Micractinium conductrix]|eukprot:PSC73783.1 Zinc phosphodiesterase ELAC 1 [Micractinium conductrix]